MNVDELESLRRRLEESERLRRQVEQERDVAEQKRDVAEQERDVAKRLRRQVEQERDVAEQERDAAKRKREVAEQEREVAEQERDVAEQERDVAKRQRENADFQTQLLTLDEYIAACHSIVYSRLAVETNPRFTTKGTMTNPRGKWCPNILKPWTDFLQLQRICFGSICDNFPAESRLFENRNFLAGLGNRISKRRIHNEKILESFLHFSVEDPVSAIMEELKTKHAIRAEFKMGNGIVFENHPHALSEYSEEVVERETPSPPRTPNYRRDLNQLRPDQICIFRSDDTLLMKRTMIYICEYKPPHKLTALHLRAGLRVVDIHKEVVNRKTIPSKDDPDARFLYHAEQLTAAAVTQTYHYMIQSGLDYGLLTTGEAIVFLKIDWNDPETLYYHLAEPTHEVMSQPIHSNICTSVGQYLAFTLLALGGPGESRGHGQDERDRAQSELKTWQVEFASMFASIPKSERSVPDNSSDYAPTTYKGVDRSPLSRRKTRQYYRDHPDENLTRPSDRDPSDDESMPRLPDTPTPLGREASQTTGQRNRQAPQTHGGGNQQQRQYCTQECLIGMVNGGKLDRKCPNLLYHDKGCTAKIGLGQHPVSHSEFLGLLKRQLKRTLDDGIIPLGMGGARGVLFQVTLLDYGYTFVSKGTVRAFIPDLEHEHAVYRRLEPIQGKYVPVFLGAADLRALDRTYYYDHRVYIIHMTFLSWGGCSTEGLCLQDDPELYDSALRSLRALHSHGVIHRDVRPLNILSNSETGTIMLIDFERSTLLHAPRLLLASTKQSRGRREPSVSLAKNMANERKRQGFAEDIMSLRGGGAC